MNCNFTDVVAGPDPLLLSQDPARGTTSVKQDAGRDVELGDG